MTTPDYEAFRRTHQAYSQVWAEHEKLMHDMVSGREPVSVELATESAHRLMAALQAWQATYPGIVGYRSA